MDPPREDGRRCLTVEEMEYTDEVYGTPKFTKNSRGTWSLTKALEAARRRTIQLPDG